MKKTTGLLLCLAIAMGSGTAAADPRGRIAFDDCYIDYWNENPRMWCDIFVTDADGSGAFFAAADGVRPVWSPDGSKIAFMGLGTGHIFVLKLGDGSITRLTSGLNVDWSLAWSPDGSRIAFYRAETGPWGLFVMNADGSGIARVTDVSGPDGRPSWAPDGSRIAFNCSLDFPNSDVCTIEPDGNGLVRLTNDAEYDGGPAFSPDGSRIAFVTQRYAGSPAIAVMNADGSGVTRVGNVIGLWPDWSFDGTRMAYTAPFVGACEADGRLCYDFVRVVNADGTSDRHLSGGARPSWRHSVQPMGPIALFGANCSGLHCNVNGSYSWDLDGTITSYEWAFGDGAIASGATAAHTYAAIGPYVITLTVTDDHGLIGTASRTVVSPPVASFTATCAGLACSFDGSASFDPGGEIVDHAWSFGDGAIGSGQWIAHTYAMPGTFAVTLTVTDNDGLTATQSQNVTAAIVHAHVGDLDGGTTYQIGSWTALVTITVHDSGHAPVANAVLTGSWSAGGTGSCATDGAGRCTVTRPWIPKRAGSVTFTVDSVTHPQLTYSPAANHDPDGDSNGTSIAVSRE